MNSMRLLRVATLVGIVGSPLAPKLPAQVDHFNGALLPTLRRAAMLIPGAAPTRVNFVLLNPFTIQRGYFD